MEPESVDSLFTDLVSRGAYADRATDETLLIGQTPYLFNLDEFSQLVRKIEESGDLLSTYESLKVPGAKSDHDYDVLGIGPSKYRFSYSDFLWLASVVRPSAAADAPASEPPPEAPSGGGPPAIEVEKTPDPEGSKEEEE